VIFSERTRRKVRTALLAGFFFAPGACKSKERAPSAPASPAVSARPRPLAPAFTLKDLKGRPVSLSDFKGKPVFLEFWATWCGPCRMSMPEVERLHEEYARKGLQVLGVSVDENPADVGPFVGEMGIRYPILMAGASGVDAQYQVSGIPAFFVIDKDGRVAGAWLGFEPAFADQWRRDIDKILAP
jgi:thiol-disulfide isomerase/thioredoxin